MPITVKHSGNAAPMAAGAFAGGASRGNQSMPTPPWGAGSRSSSYNEPSPTSRRGRRKKTYNELLEEGLTTRPAVTTATQAGFTGPTPVGAQRPNSVASQAGFAVAHNLDGTIDLTPQEIAANAMRAGVGSVGKTPTQTPAPTADPSYLDKARLERSEYDYKQRMDRSKMDYENTPLVDRQNPPKLVTSYGVEQNAQLDKLNRSYDDAVNSGKYSKSELIQLKNHVDYEKTKIRPTEKYETTMPWDEPREPDTPRDTSKDPGKTWIEHGAMFSRNEKGKVYEVSKVAEDPATVQAKEEATRIQKQKDSFVSRYEAAKKELTVEEEVYDKATGKKVKTGKFTVPKQEAVIARLREQDAAQEAYLKGVAPKEEVVDPAAGKTEIPPPVADGSPTPEQIKAVGQDPEAIGGYSSVKLTNGRFVPNTLTPFLTDTGIDFDAVKAYAKSRSEMSRGKLSESEIIAAINRQIQTLVKAE